MRQLIIALALVGDLAYAGRGTTSVIADAVHGDVAASADGEWVAYWTHDGMLNLYATGAGKVTRQYLPDDFQSHLVWAPNEDKVALAGGAGLVVYDVASDSARVVVAKAFTGTDFGYSASGRLCWIDASSLWCDGATRPIAAMNGSHHSFQQGTVVSCDHDPAAATGGCSVVWITDLDARTTVALHPKSRAFEPYLAPTRDRLCYEGGGLHCTELTTKRELLIDERGEFGHLTGYLESQPFSDDGTRLAWWSGDAIHVYDFRHDRSEAVTGVVGYKGVDFLGNDSLLLWANYGSMNEHMAKVAAIAELHLATKVIDPIVVDSHVYQSLRTIPGHRDIAFAGLETGQNELVTVVRR